MSNNNFKNLRTRQLQKPQRPVSFNTSSKWNVNFTDSFNKILKQSFRYLGKHTDICDYPDEQLETQIIKEFLNDYSISMYRDSLKTSKISRKSFEYVGIDIRLIRDIFKMIFQSLDNLTEEDKELKSKIEDIDKLNTINNFYEEDFELMRTHIKNHLTVDSSYLLSQIDLLESYVYSLDYFNFPGILTESLVTSSFQENKIMIDIVKDLEYADRDKLKEIIPGIEDIKITRYIFENIKEYFRVLYYRTKKAIQIIHSDYNHNISEELQDKILNNNYVSHVDFGEVIILLDKIEKFISSKENKIFPYYYEEVDEDGVIEKFYVNAHNNVVYRKDTPLDMYNKDFFPLIIDFMYFNLNDGTSDMLKRLGTLEKYRHITSYKTYGNMFFPYYHEDGDSTEISDVAGPVHHPFPFKIFRIEKNSLLIFKYLFDSSIQEQYIDNYLRKLEDLEERLEEDSDAFKDIFSGSVLNKEYKILLNRTKELKISSFTFKRNGRFARLKVGFPVDKTILRFLISFGTDLDMTNTDKIIESITVDNEDLDDLKNTLIKEGEDIENLVYVEYLYLLHLLMLKDIKMISETHEEVGIFVDYLNLYNLNNYSLITEYQNQPLVKSSSSIYNVNLFTYPPVSFEGLNKSIVDLITLDYLDFALKTLMKKYSATVYYEEQKRYEDGLSQTYAKSFETKKNITKKVYEHMISSPLNEYFNFYELDNEVDLEKVSFTEYDISNFLNTMYTYYPAFYLEPQLLQLRFRKLGHYNATGIFFPSEAINCISIDFRNTISFVHEYGHALDYNRGSLSLQDDFMDIVLDYSETYDRVVADEESKGGKNTSYYKTKSMYYKTPTEVFARGFEIFNILVMEEVVKEEHNDDGLGVFYTLRKDLEVYKNNIEYKPFFENTELKRNVLRYFENLNNTI